MKDVGWLAASSGKLETLPHVGMFFGVASPSSWREVWKDQHTAFRQSSRFEIDMGAVEAWLRKGELEAQRIDRNDYDPSRFREALVAIRSLTREAPSNSDKIMVNQASRA